MCIDHVGAVFFPWDFPVWIGGSAYPLLRLVGRLSFPIFAFLLSEGAVHTSNWRKYALRLLILFVLSEGIYDLLFHGSIFYPQNQNIMLTLLIGLLSIQADIWLNRKLPGTVGEVLGILTALLGCAAAELLCADYGLYGILLIYLFYRVRKSRLGQLLVLAGMNAFLYGGIQTFAVFAWIPIALYDGTPGLRNRIFRDGFYLFYPLHLAVLLLLLNLR